MYHHRCHFREYGIHYHYHCLPVNTGLFYAINRLIIYKVIILRHASVVDLRSFPIISSVPGFSWTDVFSRRIGAYSANENKISTTQS